MKKIILLTLLFIITTWCSLRSQTGDTVIVELARTSKMVLTVQDRRDLYHLRNYDFQSLFDDILTKLESSDSIPSSDTLSSQYVSAEAPEDVTVNADNDENEEVYDESYDQDYNEDYNEEDNEDYDADDEYHESFYHKVSHSFNFEFGMNNYLEDGKFPDADGALYTVRPWGSWYVGMGSVLSMRLNHKFYLDMGLGVSWYNFKFEEDNVLVIDGDDGVEFVEDTRPADFIKSKLSMSYIGASLVPMYGTYGHHHHWDFWDSHKSGFRIGLGPYVGYRLESHSKIVYEDDGDREKDKDSDNFYLNNLRYGLRLQMGVEGIDFFVNYDLNQLFADGKGPDLHAFSFGFVF